MFSNFSNFENFLIFSQNNLIIKAEETFLRNNTIWYAFYSKFANFCCLWLRKWNPVDQ